MNNPLSAISQKSWAYAFLAWWFVSVCILLSLEIVMDDGLRIYEMLPVAVFYGPFFVAVDVVRGSIAGDPLMRVFLPAHPILVLPVFACLVSYMSKRRQGKVK